MMLVSRAASIAAPSLAAWIALALGDSAIPALPSLCTARILGTLPNGIELSFALTWISPSTLLLSWAVMVISMMLPLAAGPLTHVLNRSLWRAQLRACAGFLLGYLGVWLAVGIILIGAALLARLALTNTWALFVAALGSALFWQGSPSKQAALNRCHTHPPLTDYRLGALGFGLTHGIWCIANCGPLMFAALLAPTHNTVWMILVALYIWAERLEAPRRPEFTFAPPTRALRAIRYRLTAALHPRPQ